MRLRQGAVKVVALVVLILVSSGSVLVLGSGLGLGRRESRVSVSLIVALWYRCAFGMESILPAKSRSRFLF
jgi:hypothetical protein